MRSVSAPVNLVVKRFKRRISAKKFIKPTCIAVTLAAMGVIAIGKAEAAVDTETAFVLNTFLFLVHGVLVMFMAAGFAMLESGLVRSKNTAAICLKNIALYSIAGLMYYIIGYALMYTDVDAGLLGGWIGAFEFLYNPAGAELALLNAVDAGKAAANAALLKGST